ncbi:MAG: hypothetical protein JWP51_3391 [Bradyrhizobium sp.]|nr:hypothetical protein [Bradyrhizobium sp.]
MKNTTLTDSASDDAKLYEAIGRFTVTFAIAETCADGMSAIIFNGYGGKTIVARLPRIISQKIEFLEAAAERLPDIAPLAGEIIAVVKFFKAIIEPRHFIIHGIFGENESKETVFAKPILTPDNMHMVHFPATVETIDIHRAVAEGLVRLTAGLAIRLSDNLSSRIR